MYMQSNSRLSYNNIERKQCKAMIIRILVKLSFTPGP